MGSMACLLSCEMKTSIPQIKKVCNEWHMNDWLFDYLQKVIRFHPLHKTRLTIFSHYAIFATELTGQQPLPELTTKEKL